MVKNNYAFKLTPGFCLYNGIAVIKQSGSKINFLMDNDNQIVKDRMERAFNIYINNIKKLKDCPNEFFFPTEVNFTKGSRQQLKKYVSELFQHGDSTESVSVRENSNENSEAAAVILLDTIINEATSKNATDIHIEKNIVKFRINGKLESIFQLDSNRNKELIQRIKFLAGMNVLDKRACQDGSFVFGVDKSVFVRVSTMSVISNDSVESEESLVLRLLDTKRVPLCLENLGFTKEQNLKLENLCFEKSGLILICGPTGAGKSTTAAALLLKIEELRKNNIKIISIEDPAEYIIPGITQIQVNKENPFSQVLKYVFRQDPDVLMIGEIRDEKSASVAIRASLTGHLVIATLHTSSAVSTIYRLEDLGISRNLIGAVLKGVVVQDIDNESESIKLSANISIPEESFEKKILRNKSENLDDLFVHFSNEENKLNSIKNEKRKRLLYIKGEKRKEIQSKMKA